MLGLEGNPLVLSRCYTKVITERVPTLKVLDGNTVFSDQADKMDAKKTLKKTLSRRQSKNASTTTIEDYNYQIAPNTTLDFHLRLLKNIEGGRYLIPEENCNIEVERLDEIAEEHKSSQYWMTFTDHNRKETSTEKRSYIKHFQVEELESKTVAKTDMDFKLRIDERPSIELRDWMYNDIQVTLWESRPKFVKQKEEGQEVETEKVLIDEASQLPVIETLNHGVSSLSILNLN